MAFRALLEVAVHFDEFINLFLFKKGCVVPRCCVAWASTGVAVAGCTDWTFVCWTAASLMRVLSRIRYNRHQRD